MRGVVADVNVEGYLRNLVRRIEASGAADLWQSLELDVLTFADLGWPGELPDREVWRRCQAERLALFTDNRNSEDDTSLEATLRELLEPDSLPVLTVGSLDRLRHEPGYASRVADDLLETVFDVIHLGRWRGPAGCSSRWPDQ